ncbi:MAG: hypothetical protein H7Y42_16660 [Chitinophagaceae bacterium]|nr:hypothetical protein [Chitinophagaceae bacterium]
MRLVLSLMIVTLIAFSISFTACNSSGPATFCDTACNSDMMRFSVDHPDTPFVEIKFRECRPDTITWSHNGLPAKRKLLFTDLTAKEVLINKSHFRHYIKDTSYAWLMFNDCVTAQGFLVKIPFNKSGNIFRKNSAFNPMDPKYSIADNLVAYTDKGNIFVEDMTTGKKATATLGRQVAMEYSEMHATIDTINVTADRVWVRVKIDNEWQTIEKKITLQ